VKIDAHVVEDLHDLIGEPAHWALGIALHEQHNVVRSDGTANGFNRRGHGN
jgi:hypothetical protein